MSGRLTRQASRRFAAAEVIPVTMGLSFVCAALCASIEIGLNIGSCRTAGVTWTIVLGAVSRGLLGHGLVWIAFGMMLGPFIVLGCRVTLIRRICRDPIVVAGACFSFSAAVLIGVGRIEDPKLNDGIRPAITAAVVTCGYCAIMLGVVRRGRRRRRLRNILRCAAPACLALICVAAVLLRYTPLIGPAQFAVPTFNSSDEDAIDSTGPNVVLVVLDTVRADRLSALGYQRRTTPFLDRLSPESTVFDLALSRGVWTVPGHASMFTGLSVRRHKATWDRHVLDDEFLTLAEALADAGYQTASFSNNSNLLRANLLQGFAHQTAMWSIGRMPQISLDRIQKWLGIMPVFSWQELDDGAALTNVCVADWLDTRRDAKRPFFVLVNLMEAHVLYWPPRAYREMFLKPRDVERSYEMLAEHRDLSTVVNLRMNFEGRQYLGASDQAIVRDLYDSSIRYQDDRLAELYRLLEDRQLVENTVFVVTSDHGESLGEHGHWDHQWSVYNTLAHVPLLIRYPEAFKPCRVANTVTTSDLFATLTDVCGVELDRSPYTRWVNLARTDAAQLDAGIVIEYLAPYSDALDWAARHVQGFDPTPFDRTFQAIVLAGQKLIVGSDGSTEMFDIHRDPTEQHDLAGEIPDRVDALERALSNWIRQTPEYTPIDDDKKGDLSPDVVKSLRSLGYISGPDAESEK